MPKKRVLILTGPTAVGKTDLSLALSNSFPIEIISADSRQIFKYLDIGTAKPNSEDLARVPHHLIDTLFPDQPYNAWKFREDAIDIIENIFARNKFPVVTGGTGLYIKALMDGLFEENTSYNKDIIKQQIDAELNIYGNKYLLVQLDILDPKILSIYSDHNPRRLYRALEYCLGTGKKFSDALNQQQNKTDFEFLYVVITDKRENVYQRINQRVLKMWEMGLADETQKVLDMGYDKNLNALNTVGYKETIDFLDGKISLDKTIDLIQQNTRHYAKRQITWFKREENAVWLPRWEMNSAYNLPMIVQEFFYQEHPRYQLFKDLFNSEIKF